MMKEFDLIRDYFTWIIEDSSVELGMGDDAALFTLEDVHPHDISTIIDSRGIAIRAGHHCAQPLMDRFDVAATARVSFGMYNSKGDVDALIEALAYVKDIFG